jgi:CarD family transcriptional regulator
VREVVGASGVQIVYDILRGEPDTTNLTWTKRYKENIEKISTGNLFDVAEVVKDLVSRGVKKNLSAGEKRMLNRAATMLITELSISLDEDTYEVGQRVADFLGVEPEFFE